MGRVLSRERVPETLAGYKCARATGRLHFTNGLFRQHAISVKPATVKSLQEIGIITQVAAGAATEHRAVAAA